MKSVAGRAALWAVELAEKRVANSVALWAGKSAWKWDLLQADLWAVELAAKLAEKMAVRLELNMVALKAGTWD